MRNITLFLLLFFCTYGMSQQTMDSLVAGYFSHYSNQVALFYGKEQVKYPLTIDGHPYYGRSSYVNAQLKYNDILYKNVPVKIDLYRNELIVQSPNPPFNVILDNSRVDHVRINDSLFVFIPPTELYKPVAGSYVIKLTDGSYKLYKKQNVSYEEAKDNTTVRRYFSRYVTYYLYDGNSYYKLKGKNSLLKIFKNQKRALSAFVRQNHLNFSANPDKAYIAALNFINSNE
ncbi:MAG: hypothetical protein H6Q20_964 [Bacteroidetes bacterium]|jgi:hypothetical protein|nr:hypothetical protein [Bacteroidota bacterium]